MPSPAISARIDERLAELDVYGNSVRGVAVCREMAARLGLHVFATEEEDAMLGTAPPAPEAALNAGSDG